MLEFTRQQNIYKQSYKMAYRPPGLDGIVVLDDGNDAS